MTDSPGREDRVISAEDRALIERVRMVNKTLSILVFAVQEGSALPAEGHSGIADALVALADTIRNRASGQNSSESLLDGAFAQLQLEAGQGRSDVEQSDRQPVRCGPRA